MFFRKWTCTDHWCLLLKKKKTCSWSNARIQFNCIFIAPFTTKEVKQLAEVKEDESVEDCQSAGHVCGIELGSLLYYSASKSCYYQTNGPTRGGGGGHVAFIWELNDSLELPNQSPWSMDQNHNKSRGFSTSHCSIGVLIFILLLSYPTLIWVNVVWLIT